MNRNSIRYAIVSLVALFAVVGTANAVGVFYYDSATNQFVLDGNLKISDPGSFKLFLRELNVANDDHLYINGRKDVQIRVDTDNNGTNNLFKVNNGANSTVFSVDESGALNSIGSITSPTVNATTITAGTQLNSSGSLSVTGDANVGRLYIGGTRFTSTVHSWSPKIMLADGQAVVWGGGWTYGHTTDGYYWGNSTDYTMSLDNAGRLIVYGSEGVSAYKFCLPGGGGFSNCITTWPSGSGTAAVDRFGGMFAFVSTTGYTPRTWSTNDFDNISASNCTEAGGASVNPYTGSCTCPANYHQHLLSHSGNIYTVFCSTNSL